MDSCLHCKSEVQPDWKACPACGDRVGNGQDASLNITDSTVMEGFRMEPFLPPLSRSWNFLFNFNLITSSTIKDTINDNK